MKSIILILSALFFSLELQAQTYYTYPVNIKLNKEPSSVKERLTEISLGLGVAKAFRYKYDKLERDNYTRFLVNINLTTRVYRPLYFIAGFEYNKKDVDGYFDTFNISLLPAYGGRVFNNKISYFAEAGPNLHAVFWRNQSASVTLGLTVGFKAQYNITEKFAAGIDVRHLNYFNNWSEHYFIVHSNVYFAMKI